MTIDELLRRLVAILEGLELPYLLTGSMATTLFGEPRFTNDIDVVVDLPARRIEEFCAAFPSDEFYVDEESVRRAVEGHLAGCPRMPGSSLTATPLSTSHHRSHPGCRSSVRPACCFAADTISRTSCRSRSPS